MENEIMINEEVIEGATEVATVDSIDSKKGLVAVVVGVAAIAAVVGYKKLVKPWIAKRKAKKEAKVIEAECTEPENDQEDSEEI